VVKLALSGGSVGTIWLAVHAGALVAVGPTTTGALVLVLVAVGLIVIGRVAVRVGVCGALEVTVGNGVTVAGSGVVVTGTKTMTAVCVAARVGCAELFGNRPHPVALSAIPPNTIPAIRLKNFTTSP
jgi:hypothetical protein